MMVFSVVFVLAAYLFDQLGLEDSGFSPHECAKPIPEGGVLLNICEELFWDEGNRF